MKRRYHTTLYKDRITYIKDKMPDCCIGVDVIVGFPGETEELFQETFNLLNELDISYLHVFTYSKELIEAATMKGVVDKNVRHQRSKMLRILSAKKNELFMKKTLVLQELYCLSTIIRTASFKALPKTTLK